MDGEGAERPFLKLGVESQWRVTTGRIRHQVAKVNPEFAEAFNLAEGDRNTQFGFFACDPLTKRCTPFTVGARPGHHRGLPWSDAMTFHSKDGTTYEHVTLKGMGHLQPMKKFVVIPSDITPRGPHDFNGLMSYEDAAHDMEMGEQFAKWGIATSRGIAILDLEELDLPSEGLLSIDDLSSRAQFDELQKFRPVIYVRAFGASARVNEYKTTPGGLSGADRDLQWQALSEAMRFMERRYGLQENALDVPGYLQLFADTLGTNIGIMHRQGVWHRWISNGDTTPQNVTLAAEIVDLDDVQRIARMDHETTTKQIELDKQGGRRVLKLLLHMNFNDNDATSRNQALLDALTKRYEQAYQVAYRGK